MSPVDFDKELLGFVRSLSLSLCCWEKGYGVPKRANNALRNSRNAEEIVELDLLPC